MGVRYGVGELFSKICSYLFFMGGGFGGKFVGFIRKDIGMYAIKGFQLSLGKLLYYFYDSRSLLFLSVGVWYDMSNFSVMLSYVMCQIFL